MPRTTILTGVGTNKSNGTSSSSSSEQYPAGSARPPQDMECVQEAPVPETDREGTDSDTTESNAEALDPVNMATGEYICEDKDFILPDMGGEFSVTRRYTGPLKKKPNRSIGKVWALNTDTFVTEEENTATVTMPDGKTAEYIKCGSVYINKKSGTKKVHA